MSAHWAWAFDTPFPWFKQIASQPGRRPPGHGRLLARPHHGCRAASPRPSSMHMSLTWCRRILEVSGISTAPEIRRRHQAKRRSRARAWRTPLTRKNAKEPSRHKTQYFEMMGQWALYHEGWLLSTMVNRAPWEAFGAANPDPLNNQVLELYDLNKDFSQSQNIADKFPAKVKELKEMFIKEARKYEVLPLDASVAARIVAPRPNITAGRKEFVYTRPMVGLPQGDSPMLLDASYTITADIEVPAGRRRGHDPDLRRTASPATDSTCSRASRCSSGTWSTWNASSGKARMRSAPGKAHAGVRLQVRGPRRGHARVQQHERPRTRPGTGTLKVDGKQVATKKMPKTLPMILQWDESFDIGSDTLTGVNDADYKPPFTLTAKLNKLTIKVDRPELSPEDIKKLEAAMRDNKASE